MDLSALSKVTCKHRCLPNSKACHAGPQEPISWQTVHITPFTQEAQNPGLDRWLSLLFELMMLASWGGLASPTFDCCTSLVEDRRVRKGWKGTSCRLRRAKEMSSINPELGPPNSETSVVRWGHSKPRKPKRNRLWRSLFSLDAHAGSFHLSKNSLEGLGNLRSQWFRMRNKPRRVTFKKAGGLGFAHSLPYSGGSMLLGKPTR